MTDDDVEVRNADAELSTRSDLVTREVPLVEAAGPFGMKLSSRQPVVGATIAFAGLVILLGAAVWEVDSLATKHRLDGWATLVIMAVTVALLFAAALVVIPRWSRLAIFDSGRPIAEKTRR